MESLLLDILSELTSCGKLDDKQLAKIIRRHNKSLTAGLLPYSKKRLLPYYLKIKNYEPVRWKSWQIDKATEKLLVQSLRVKPRRTASGVATITVITKPWKCLSDCLYCPNDVRMPKSYLCDEPACQRAEQNYFDPYLQVRSRLHALTHMGHSTDKIELIVLGGTWTEYPQDYQIWFIHELFRALNDGDAAEKAVEERRQFYENQGLNNTTKELVCATQETQTAVNRGELKYNQAIDKLYLHNDIHQNIAAKQTCNLSELTAQHIINEHAQNRVVGLVIETRPDTITIEKLTLLRSLGCTKIQIGIQSLDPEILKANKRDFDLERLKTSFFLLRLFGFKIHAHFMLNLLGATPEIDEHDYHKLVTASSYIPDEVKLYPCSLVEGTGLCEKFANKSWQPYSEKELVRILAHTTQDTPPFIRISRMIRDISAHDIIAGNKKANLRQMVEQHIEAIGGTISEIRYREIATNDIKLENLMLDIIPFETVVGDEYFLQWITPSNKIAGFLRLSLPKENRLSHYHEALPCELRHAMIREVHVYGKVAKLRQTEEGAQHLGLGKKLIEKACSLAKAKHYTHINVISSVGTRKYYRNLGFHTQGLYQQKPL